MALNRALADEGSGYHHGLEMNIVIAGHQRLAAAQAGLDELRYLLCVHYLLLYTRYDSRMNSGFTDEDLVELGRQALTIEIDGLRAQLPRLGGELARACRICLDCRGRVVVTGMGKSGHIGGKIAATLASTGTPSFFMHPGEASHGDVGMITRDDAVLALSNSGETAEILTILPVIKRLGVP